MAAIIQILIYSAIIIIIHELGHYLILRILNVPIYKMGLSYKPMPHFFIRYKWPKNFAKHCLIILFGSIMTIAGFVTLHFLVDYSVQKYLFFAYITQIIFETNPFFSDFVFVSVIYKNKLHSFNNQGIKNYQSKIKEYIFSPMWYIHFGLWSALTVFLIRQITF